MGQGMSNGIHPKHVGIYNKILQIKIPATRVQIIETVLLDHEVKQSAQRTGVYGPLLQYIASVRSGRPIQLPGEAPAGPPQTAVFQPLPTPFSQGSALPPPIQIQNHRTTAGNAGNAGNVADRGGSTSDQYQQQLALRNGGGIFQNNGKQDPFQVLQKSNRSEKALNFFTACLRVLGIQEEIALTESTLKKSYKKAALKAHPDKGGSDAALDAVTRAYAYLSEVLTIVEGRKVGKGKTMSVGGGGGEDTRKVPSNMNEAMMMRERESSAWNMSPGGSAGSGGSGAIENMPPVKLNPKNLDMNAFNALFEKMKLPDPENDGYGDWLKGNGGEGNAPTFSGKYNRDVFNRMFTDHTVRDGEHYNNGGNPESLDLAPTFGTEIGNFGGEHTSAFDSSLGYTDLKSAYTKHNTISNQVANVKIEDRNLESYRASRERGPDPFSAEERRRQEEWERQQKEKEKRRQIRAAEQQMAVTSHFERLKQYTIVDK